MGVSSSKPHPIETKWFPEFEKGLPSLEGKTVAITGSTTGMGFIVARTAVRKGAENVLLLNRQSERSANSEKLLQEEKQKINSPTKVIETISCDLQDFDSVREAANAIKSKYEAIDVLCNNAGVMALEDKATKDGYDVQMQTNHLSHFLLTKELFPLLLRACELHPETPARVANHTSSARKYPSTQLKAEYFGKNGGSLGGNGASMLFGGARWERYHQSKLANSVFTMAFNEKADVSKVIMTCADPGVSATNLQISTAADGGMGSGMWFMRLAQSAEDGAMPILSACFSPEVKTGSIWAPSLRGGIVGPAEEIPMDPLSCTKGFNDMLWKESEEACGEFVPKK